MPTLFENKYGFVVRASSEPATKALLRVTGKPSGIKMHSIETIFVTSLSLSCGVNNNVAYTLDNGIFLSASGDRLGAMGLHGLAFGSVCKDGVENNLGDSHGGLKAVLDFYKEHRIVSGQKVMPQIEIIYSGSNDNWTKHTGLVHGASSTTADASNGSMNFQLDCHLIPEA